MDLNQARATFHPENRQPIALPSNLPPLVVQELGNVLTADMQAGRFLDAYSLELEQRIHTLIIERDEAIAARRDVPRTIVLTYMPRQPMPEKMDAHAAFDDGGHWTVSEAGRHMGYLDAREVLAQVAAMLLVAPHPLNTIADMENRGAHRERMRQQSGRPLADAVSLDGSTAMDFQERPHAD